MEYKSLDDLSIPFSTQFETMKSISHHTIPILAGKSIKEIKFIGTGVYIKNGVRRYIATANHVIEGLPVSEILILPRQGKATSIPAIKCISSNNPMGDIALFEINQELLQFEPIETSKLSEPIKTDNFVYLMGFPGTRVKRTGIDSMAFEQRFVITKIIADGGKYFQSFDERSNFACDFRKRKVMNGNGNIVSFPDPYGMSGGCAFEITYSKENQFSNYKLIGLMTEWNNFLKRYVRCTKASIIQFMIEQMART